jgi:hypothetical protein
MSAPDGALCRRRERGPNPPPQSGWLDPRACLLDACLAGTAPPLRKQQLQGGDVRRPDSLPRLRMIGNRETVEARGRGVADVSGARTVPWRSAPRSDSACDRRVSTPRKQRGGSRHDRIVFSPHRHARLWSHDRSGEIPTLAAIWVGTRVSRTTARPSDRSGRRIC